MAHNGKGRHARNGNGRRNGNGNAHPNRDHQAPPPVWFTARKRRRERPKPSKLPLFVLSAFLLLFTFTGTTVFATLVVFQGGVSAYNEIERALPPLTELANHETYKTAQIFDRKGMLLWEFNHPEGGKRTVVPISDISQNLIDATLAAEDANFYANPGVDVRALARAVVQNVSGGGVVSGASTITQQLVKNVLIPENERFEQTPMRKVKEALLAVQVNEQFSKSQILEMYLNEILYGNLAYGAEAAAQTYFGKHARDLTLGEASLLAGLPQAPSAYDPYQNIDAATRRQGYVLDQMERHGFVTPEQAEEARNEELVLTHKQQQILSPHWSQYVRSIVEQKYGEKVLYQGGLKIYTTLDSDLQNRLEEVARGNQELFDKWQANNTAIVAINPRTGEILAMVGSRDFNNTDIDGQVNVAISERQPGSAIKPLVYATAFQRGWGPSTVVDDAKSCWLESIQTQKEWCPQNYDLKFNGKMTIRSALGNSINIPAVRALEFAGIDAVKAQAEKEGITTWGDKFLGLSLTLGGAEMKPLELAGLYTVFANNGLWIPPVSITKIVDAYGDVLEEYRVPQGEQVMDPRIAYQINHILSDNNARLITFGPNNVLADFDRPVAAKTGTTDNYRDTWTVGYTPNLVVGVWFGNTNGTPMVKAISSLSAGKVWHDAIQATFEHLQLPVEPFQRPEGLVERDFCGPGISACPYKEFWLKERQNQIPVKSQPTTTEPRPSATPDGQTDGEPSEATPGPSQPDGQPQPAADQPGPDAEPTKRAVTSDDQPPVEPVPTPAAPAEPAPPEPAPAEPQPAPVEPQPAPVEPAPAEPAPAEPAPEPVDPVQEQPAPEEPAPVEPQPAG